MPGSIRVYQIEVVATEPQVDKGLLRWLLEVDGLEINWIDEK
jgi:hypothetical protein